MRLRPNTRRRIDNLFLLACGHRKASTLATRGTPAGQVSSPSESGHHPLNWSPAAKPMQLNVRSRGLVIRYGWPCRPLLEKRLCFLATPLWAGFQQWMNDILLTNSCICIDFVNKRGDNLS
jgi:hypothetical protein